MSLKYLSIAALYLLRCPLVSAATCIAVIYGTPTAPDCHQALQWIPFAQTAPSDPLSQQLRIFAEPQYLATPFAGVDNMYRPRAIVQLPKIWKRKSCTIALVTHGDAQGGVFAPQFVTNWRNVVDQSRPLLDCLDPNHPQGGYTPFQLSTGVAAGIYMFTTESPFNQIQFSDHALLGTPIVPFLDQFGSVRNDSAGVGFINGSAGMV